MMNVRVDRGLVRADGDSRRHLLVDVEALEANRRRDYRGARLSLAETAERIACYAGSDPKIREVVVRLRVHEAEYGRERDAMEMKRRHCSSEQILKSRGIDGKARRVRVDQSGEEATGGHRAQ